MKHDPQPAPRTPARRQASREMRSAERFALLLRRAKLVCDSGEFPCVIRDVSATGLRLRLFHALPAERHFALELANGDVYCVEPVRAGDGREAGFRFAASIDVPTFLREASPFPKREIRLRLKLPALVIATGNVGQALVCDLSQSGARIESGRYLYVGQQIRLQAQGLPDLAANVRWRLGAHYGVVFQQYLAFDELARLLSCLQPPLEPGIGGSTGPVRQLGALTARAARTA